MEIKRRGGNLGHGSEEVLDVGQLAVVVGQNAFNGVHEELLRFGTGLQLLLALLLRPLLGAKLLLQVFLATRQPFGAADREVRHRTLLRGQHELRKDAYGIERSERE